MRSIHDMPNAVRKRIRGVVFDIDDTVTRNGKLEQSAFDAMWQLSRAGVMLVSVTGRPLGWADVVARLWPIGAAVGENGAGWSHWRNGGLHEGYFDPPESRVEQQACLRRVEHRVGEVMPHVRLAADQRARRCDLAFDIAEAEHLSQQDVSKLAALVESEGAKALVSSVHVHVVPGSWNKARGTIHAVRDVAGIDIEQAPEAWCFVGDSGNDDAGFAFFPVSVGVANVRDHIARLPTPPAYVTDLDRGEGFAELAAVLLEARRA